MSESDSVRSWPQARIGDVARLRAIAAARPHVAYLERTIEAPFVVVWSILGDLEGGVPRFDHYVRWIRIRAREGEQLEVESNAPFPGLVMRWQAIHRSGFCVMRSFQGEVGMAAEPIDATRTRIAHFEGSRFLGRVGRWWFTRTMQRELDTLARLCREQEARAQELSRVGDPSSARRP